MSVEHDAAPKWAVSKPSKRDVIRALIRHEYDLRRADLVRAREEADRLGQEHQRCKSAVLESVRQLPLPAGLAGQVERLRALGLDCVVDRALGPEGRPVARVSVGGGFERELPISKRLEALAGRERAALDRYREALARKSELERGFGRELDQQDLLLMLLPPEAGPHLEALRELMRAALARKSGEL